MNIVPDFSKNNGLVPTIAQDAQSGEILMLAWMNQEAWEATLKDRYAVYWSRSRNKLWKKGEHSGNLQLVQEIFLDCDEDTVLLKVKQTGAACHTGRSSCFYKKLVDGSLRIVLQPLFNPLDVYEH